MEVLQFSHAFRTAGPYSLLDAQIFSLLPVLLVLVPGIFYISTLRSALLKCSPESRTIDPGKLWLLLIPIFNLGLAMCILMVCPFPIFMILLMPAGLICWVVYWVKISGYSRAFGELRHETLPAT